MIKVGISSTWAWTPQGLAAFKHRSNLYVSTAVHIQIFDALRILEGKKFWDALCVIAPNLPRISLLRVLIAHIFILINKVPMYIAKTLHIIKFPSCCLYQHLLVFQFSIHLGPRTTKAKCQMWQGNTQICVQVDKVV
jgi:hypothetical protein